MGKSIDFFLYLYYIVATVNEYKQILKNRTRNSADRINLMEVLQKLSSNHSRLESIRAGKLKLNVSEARCLLAFDHQRYVTVKSLARSLNLVKSRVVRIIDGLAAKNLVERHPDPQDGRICLISLTAGGRNKLTELSECCEECFENLWVNFDHPQKRQLIGAMEDFAIHMDAEYSRELSSESSV